MSAKKSSYLQELAGRQSSRPEKWPVRLPVQGRRLHCLPGSMPLQPPVRLHRWPSRPLQIIGCFCKDIFCSPNASNSPVIVWNWTILCMEMPSRHSCGGTHVQLPGRGTEPQHPCCWQLPERWRWHWSEQRGSSDLGCQLHAAQNVSQDQLLGHRSKTHCIGQVRVARNFSSLGRSWIDKIFEHTF